MVMVVGLSPACEITMEFKPPGLPIALGRVSPAVGPSWALLAETSMGGTRLPGKNCTGVTITPADAP